MLGANIVRAAGLMWCNFVYKDYLKFDQLSQEQLAYKIPENLVQMVFNFSIDWERICENGIAKTELAVRRFNGDIYQQAALKDDAQRMHIILSLIDCFHCEVPGSAWNFFRLASQKIGGLPPPLCDQLVLPVEDSTEGDYESEIHPPIQFYSMNSEGKIEKNGEVFDRENPVSMRVNFFKGLTKGTDNQKEMFSGILSHLLSEENEAGLQWDRPENDPILRPLMKAATKGGRPPATPTDIQAIQYTIAKCTYFTRWKSSEAMPSVNGVVTDVLKAFNTKEHNIRKENSKLSEILKKKIKVRGLT